MYNGSSPVERHYITPTSYGAVLSKISSERKLHRAYLNRDAVQILLENTDAEAPNASELKKMITVRGFDWDEVLSAVKHRAKDFENCYELISNNKWKLFSYTPTQISIQLVNYCNAACWFCYSDSPQSDAGMKLQPEIVFKIKDFAARNGVKLGYSGGEPTLHPQLFELLSYRCDEVFDTLITNFLPKIDLKELIRTQVDLIQVSVHGFGEYHDRTIGIAGGYAKMRENILKVGSDINISTNTVVTERTFSSIKKLVADLMRIQKEIKGQLTYARFVLALPSGAGAAKVKLLNSLANDFRTLMEELIEEYPDINFEIPILHSNRYEYFLKDNYFLCPAGTTVCALKTDGRLTPCNQFASTETASKMNVIENDIHEIWLNDEVFRQWRKGIPVKTSSGQSVEEPCFLCNYLLLKESEASSESIKSQ